MVFSIIYSIFSSLNVIFQDGKGKRVGNPLAKDYLNRVEDGTLSALSGKGADFVLKLNKSSNYWKMNHKRIE